MADEEIVDLGPTSDVSQLGQRSNSASPGSKLNVIQDDAVSQKDEATNIFQGNLIEDEITGEIQSTRQSTVNVEKITSLESLMAFLSSRDNACNQKYISDIPEICKDVPCQLGVDEAGRGPVLGPMVYGIAFCPIEKSEILKDLGCADSKQLTEEKRDTIFEEINGKDWATSCLGWAIDVISPNVISNSMQRKSKCSLNEVSMDSAIGLIQLAIDAGVNIAEIYVDTVGPPDKYEAKLSAIFPDYQITVAKKADSTYPIVSAASICAKVSRDHALKVWKFPEGLNLTQANFGSGYPADPVTKRFLTENIDPIFGYPRLVRFSWSTAENALDGTSRKCNVDENEDEANKMIKAAKKRMKKFFKEQTKDGEDKWESARYFQDRKIEHISEF